jgi:amidohydrolase
MDSSLDPLSNSELLQAIRSGDPSRAMPALASLRHQLRRHLHRHPELSGHEQQTAALVAGELRRWGWEVREGVGRTGVTAELGPPDAPLVALRTDMDALPIEERTNLPYASSQQGLMHACGHDIHTTVGLGVARLLAWRPELLRSRVRLLFQPAEEMPPEGEDGGAKMMVAEGAMQNPKPDAVFGLHVTSRLPVGVIGYRPGPTMASSDSLKITVRGSQTHGAMPWFGVDPIVTSAQVVMGLQTVVSRQIDLTREPAVVTIGTIHGGLRQNIIPDLVVMTGTIRTFDEAMRDDVHERVKYLGETLAKANRANCVVCIDKNYPVTVNDPVLTEAMRPSLARSVGEDKLMLVPKVMGSEDFSFFQREAPGLFYFVGVVPQGVDPMKVAPNHSPRFYVDEGCLIVGVRSMAHLASDFLHHGTAA